MRLAMIAVMNHFIDSGLAHTVAGAVSAIVGAASAVSWIFETSALKPKSRVVAADCQAQSDKTRVCACERAEPWGTPDFSFACVC